jgi:hypothetical protein
MARRRQDDGKTTVRELAILASNCGLVDKSDEGKRAFTAWLANDPKAARKALFSRVAAQRVAASAAEATAPPKNYPQTWLRAAGIGNRRATAAAGARRARITEAGD